jgi:hypothetical protein
MSTDTNLDPNDFLNSGSGSGYPGVKFPEIGAEVKGKLVSTPRVVPVTNDDDGTTENVLIIELDPGVDTWTGTKAKGYTTINGEPVALWVRRKGWMVGAIRDAVSEAGATGLAEGGELHVRYTGDGQASKSTWTPPKLYKAKYTPPAQNVSLDDF